MNEHALQRQLLSRQIFMFSVHSPLIAYFKVLYYSVLFVKNSSECMPLFYIVIKRLFIVRKICAHYKQLVC